MGECRSLKCSWCGTANPVPERTHCSACAAALPPLPGEDPGESPPPPPRELPQGYRWRRFRTVIDWLSCFFFFFVFGWSLLFPLIYGLILRKKIRNERRKLDALERGVPARGEVIEVQEIRKGFDDKPKIHWGVRYVFDGPDGVAEGMSETHESAYAQFSPGDAVWVVVDPADPEGNDLWPPLP